MLSASDVQEDKNPDVIMENGKPKKVTILSLHTEFQEFKTEVLGRLDTLERYVEILRQHVPTLTATSYAFDDQAVRDISEQLR